MNPHAHSIIRSTALILALAARPSAVALTLIGALSLAGCGADVGIAAATTAGLEAQAAKNALATKQMALDKINQAVAADAIRAQDASRQAQAEADSSLQAQVSTMPAADPATPPAPDTSAAMKAADDQTK